jgi:glycerophosphoryl diester phosphodiesterase
MLRIVLSLILLLCSGCARSTVNLYPQPAAHRADREAGVDNSRTAILSALAAGIPYIEIDVRPTRDDGLVLYHEKRIHHPHFVSPSIPHGTLIREIPLAALRAEALADGSGPVLLFSEALDLLVGTHGVYLLDIKEPTKERVSRMLDLVREKNLSANIIVQCQAPIAAELMRQHYPDIPFLARVHELSDLTRYLELRPAIVQLDPEEASSAIVNSIRSSSSLILMKAVDTKFDSPKGWRELRSRGADIVLTDRPKELYRRLFAASSERAEPVPQ